LVCFFGEFAFSAKVGGWLVFSGFLVFAPYAAYGAFACVEPFFDLCYGFVSLFGGYYVCSFII
jgi:hypothetical protein